MKLKKILSLNGSSLFFPKDGSWRNWLTSQLVTIGKLPDLHPDHVTIETETLQWSLSFKLITEGTKGYLKSKAAQFSYLCSFSLNKSSKEAVKIASELVAWLFERDDQLDQKEHVLGEKPDFVKQQDERNLEVLKGNISPETPSERALQDLRNQALKHNADLQTLIAQFRVYFQANWVEADRRYQHAQGLDTSQFTTVNSYYEFRIFTSAVQVYYELVSRISNDSLTDEEKDHAVIRKLSNTSAYIIGVHNDLFSLGKELEEDYAENLVLIEMRQNNLTLKEALSKVILNVNQFVKEYKVLRDDFLSKPGNEKYTGYIERMDQLIDGNIIFSLKSERYKTIPKDLLE
jgi:hypothetical protein